LLIELLILKLNSPETQISVLLFKKLFFKKYISCSFPVTVSKCHFWSGTVMNVIFIIAGKNVYEYMTKLKGTQAKT